MATQVSPRGAFDIAVHEGIVPTRYRDLAGVATWGIGHTREAGEPNPINMDFAMPKNVSGAVAEAIRVFMNDLSAYAADVVKAFGPMEQHELDGWTSWHFNTGGAFSSSAVQLWRDGKKRSAVAKMREWNKATVSGRRVVSPALVKRREAEAALILTGRGKDTPTATIPVWPTDGAGAVKWTALRGVSFKEFAAALGSTGTPKAATPAVLAPVVVGGIVAASVTFWDHIEGAFAWLTNLF